jgi:hypothetical protein
MTGYNVVSATYLEVKRIWRTGGRRMQTSLICLRPN